MALLVYLFTRFSGQPLAVHVKIVSPYTQSTRKYLKARKLWKVFRDTQHSLFRPPFLILGANGPCGRWFDFDSSLLFFLSRGISFQVLPLRNAPTEQENKTAVYILPSLLGSATIPKCIRQKRKGCHFYEDRSLRKARKPTLSNCVYNRTCRTARIRVEVPTSY